MQLEMSKLTTCSAITGKILFHLPKTKPGLEQNWRIFCLVLLCCVVAVDIFTSAVSLSPSWAAPGM